jgi:hypothetical protein
LSSPGHVHTTPFWGVLAHHPPSTRDARQVPGDEGGQRAEASDPVLEQERLPDSPQGMRSVHRVLDAPALSLGVRPPP